MTFTQSLATCFGKYATFSGRASRSEYWYFMLFYMVVVACADLIDRQLFAAPAPAADASSAADVAAAAQTGLHPVKMVVSLALFLPQLSAGWRRLHDTGRSGLYFFLPVLLTASAFGILFFGIGAADVFYSGGAMDRLFTGVTLILVIGLMILMIFSPLLVLWWLTRPSQPTDNKYGPTPRSSAT